MLNRFERWLIGVDREFLFIGITLVCSIEEDLVFVTSRLVCLCVVSLGRFQYDKTLLFHRRSKSWFNRSHSISATILFDERSENISSQYLINMTIRCVSGYNLCLSKHKNLLYLRLYFLKRKFGVLFNEDLCSTRKIPSRGKQCICGVHR